MSSGLFGVPSESSICSSVLIGPHVDKSVLCGWYGGCCLSCRRETWETLQGFIYTNNIQVQSGFFVDHAPKSKYHHWCQFLRSGIERRVVSGLCGETEVS